jgi:hypothetical protein
VQEMSRSVAKAYNVEANDREGPGVKFEDVQVRSSQAWSQHVLHAAHALARRQPRATGRSWATIKHRRVSTTTVIQTGHDF